MRFFFNPITGQMNAGPPREIAYSDTAPLYPLEGSRWYDTINLREYVYTGTAWVESGVGPAGVKGDTGEKGDKGDVGPIGPVGPQGSAATIAVGAVTTGAAGTSASVSNSGTSGAAVFNFTIPQGAVGAAGAIGPIGPQGPQGVKGDDGASISLKGAVAAPANLTSIAAKTKGDLYVAQSDGNGYVWDGSAWVNVGQIRGPKGDTGAQGPAGPAPAGTGAVVVSNGILGTPVGYDTTNTANTLVRRDASGNFSAGTITGTFSGNLTGSVTGNVAGNASTASKLATARAINVSGDVTGTAQDFDGSAAITIPTSIAAGVIVDADINASAAIVDTKLATISTANKVSNSATTATSANTASAIVARDTNGNFSAGTITAALSGNATTASSAAKFTTARNINGVAFDGSADITVPAILPARLGASAQTITDWDAALENGWYMAYNAINQPGGIVDWWLGSVEVHNANWVTQTVHRFTGDSSSNTEVWRRSSWDNGGGRSWQSWYKLQLSQAEQDARYVQIGQTPLPYDLLTRLSDESQDNLTTDWNNATQQGFYTGLNAANSPPAQNNNTSWIGFVQGHNSQWLRQTLYSHLDLNSGPSDSTNAVYVRHKNHSNGWTPWALLRLTEAQQDARYSLIGHTHSEITNLLPKVYENNASSSGFIGVFGSYTHIFPVSNANIINLRFSVTPSGSDLSSIIYFRVGSSTANLTSYTSSGARINGNSVANFSVENGYIASSNSATDFVGFNATFIKYGTTNRYSMYAWGPFATLGFFVGSCMFELPNFDRITAYREDGSTFLYSVRASCIVL